MIYQDEEVKIGDDLDIEAIENEPLQKARKGLKFNVKDLSKLEVANLYRLRFWSREYFESNPVFFDYRSEILAQGDFDLVGVIKKIVVSSADQRVTLFVQLYDKTVAEITLVPGFPTSQDFQKFDLVRLRSVYLPQNLSDHELPLRMTATQEYFYKLQEQELALAKSLDRRKITLKPSSYFNCLRLPAYFQVCQQLAMHFTFDTKAP